MHLGAVDGAAEQLLEGQGTVARVQEQRREHLVRPRAQACGEIAPGAGRAGEGIAALQLGGQVAAAQLQCRGQAAGAGRAQAGQAHQVGRGTVEQHPQRAVVAEQLARGLDRVLAAQARTQEDGEQFGVGEHRGTVAQQLLAGTFGGGPVAYVHRTRMALLMPAGHQGRPGLRGKLAAFGTVGISGRERIPP